MHIAQKARVATIAVLATTLLAGCSASEPSANAGPAPSSTVEEAAPTQTLSPEEAFREAATGGVAVTVTEVIGPRTFLVEPRSFEGDTMGYAGEITVQLNPASTLTTPAENECGYAETLAFAKQFFAENPDANVEGGVFISDPYYPTILAAGFAYVAGQPEDREGEQRDARTSGAGLWSICPDFGTGR